MAIGSAARANDFRNDQLSLAANGVQTEAVVVAHERCELLGVGWCPHDHDRATVRFSRGGDRFTDASVRVPERPPLRSRVVVRYDPADPGRAQLADDPPALYWIYPMLTGPLVGLLVAAGVLARPALRWRAARRGRGGAPPDQA